MLLSRVATFSAVFRRIRDLKFANKHLIHNNNNNNNIHLRSGSEICFVRKMSSNQHNERKLNRLALEKSPYLLQHATNPVDWYPWGQEAFDKAKEEDKLIFLSVGYSTCHWCHVMESESFEDPTVAAIMNEHFVNIKVDREERPDVDKLYMAFIQATIGNGGWPMSVFLTPDLEPLLGGTYFPPEDRYGRPGFKTVLLNCAEQWKERKSALSNVGKTTVEALRRSLRLKSEESEVPGEESFKKCAQMFKQHFDEDNGGFSDAPKFPQPVVMNFLFHIYSRKRNDPEGLECLEMCLKTLKKMAYGGINDHVGKGFSRYSVDERWHVPHFEKMLYDQAQLAVSYCDAYVLTRDEFYAENLRNILAYVNRDLSHFEGGFYGAQDADSYPYEGAPKKKEGAFYVWDYDEIYDLLKDEKISSVTYADVFNYHFNVRKDGNVSKHEDHHGMFTNKNVLICDGSYEETAGYFEITVKQLKEVLNKCCDILFEVREKRPKPDTDTKIVTAWNGLMISAYAKAGFALKDQSYIDRAVRAAKFIKRHLYNENDKLLLRCCYGDNTSDIVQTQKPIAGFLDDYAFLIRGLLDLYEATLDVSWLQWAETLQEIQNDKFWDEEGHAYFVSPEGDPSILIRKKDDQDGAEPCGNSVSAHNLMRLNIYLDRKDLNEKAKQIFAFYHDKLEKIPIALPEMTSAMLFYYHSPPQVFIAGETEDNNTQALLDVVRMRFMPGRVLAVADGPGGRAGLLYQRHECLSKIQPIHGKPAAYVCRNFACALPVTEPKELADSLDETSFRAE